MSKDTTKGKSADTPKAGIKKPANGAVLATGTRVKRQVALGSVLAPLVQPALARQGVLLAQIVPHWRAICPLLAEHSCPESVRGDVLSVAVVSDGVKQELHYVTPQIIENITRLLGYAAVSKVRAVTRHDLKRSQGRGAVRQPPAAPPATAVGDKAASLCKSVRDEDLRAALAGLGQQILTEQRKK